MTFPSNPIYKFIKDKGTNENISVYKRSGSDGSWKDTIIPFDEANTDYQAYLEWVKQGNTAEEAD